ncbi:MAG: SOS response-associated peptidase [Gemmatimonadetes bacterium]|nr:SOS response-associated peptidase [Gemmatimonadota bacterium]
MCGRLSQNLTWQQIYTLYTLPVSAPRLDPQPRFNGAPTQDFALCRLDESGMRSMSVLRWGLVPFWAKDIKIGARMINARAETVQEKPAFRSAFRTRRCLIPANGWFEWKRTGPTGGGKQPYFLALESGSPLSFAALWEQWGRGGEHLETFTIITTEASSALVDIHDRQPAVVDPDDYIDWLDPGTPAETLLEIIGTPHEGPYEIRPVSDQVNRVANDTPDILKPLEKQTLF